MDTSVDKLSMVHHARKWSQLGIETIALKMVGQHGSKKLFRGGLPLTLEVLQSTVALPPDLNFLGLRLRGSGIFCLDVEGVPGSVDGFYKVLSQRGVDPGLLMMETTINGGLHVYFRLPKHPLRTEHFRTLGDIRYDILCDRRSFTAPSHFHGRSYQWIGERFFQIESFDEIPEFPESLSEFIDI